VSTREIKQKLREVIDQEDKTNPVTDDQLVEIMHEAGYPIARRTVAKYREQMEIPVARIRRQMIK
jgi:RNA polymerase sigma-54 factor